VNISIRFARQSDTTAIKNFQIAMARETEKIELDEDTVRKGVSAIFEKKAVGRYVVAEVDDQVVASLLLLEEWSDWRNGVVWWIHSLYVLPGHRGSGVFRQMYDFVRKTADTMPEIRGLRLYVEKHNERAQAVYRKVGMSADHYDMYEWMKTF
jgi:GNAT superfamily N-acetyltransferase